MTCAITGKLRYLTATAAHKALSGMRETKARSDKSVTAGWHKGEARVYRCAYCHDWHIGHQAKSDARQA